VLADDGDVAAFWEQVRLCATLHVLGAGTPRMFVVTRDARLFGRLQELQAGCGEKR
jgi:hypothetical protein